MCHACNKSIKTFLISNYWFWLKYECSFHNIAFSSEKLNLSESGEKYQAKKIQNNSEENVLVDFDVRGQRGIDFSLKEVLLWIIMDVDFS